MSTIHLRTYHSPVGPIILGACNGKLCLCDWPQSLRHIANKLRIQDHLGGPFIQEDSDLLQEAILQLDEYFSMQRSDFDLPLLLIGTKFQKQVWRALREIPYGETISYKTLAMRIDRPTAARAVASAVGSNPISIIVPCHRIIGSDGQPGGYAGGVYVKRQLLELEGNLTTPF